MAACLEKHDGSGNAEIEGIGAALLRNAGKRVRFPGKLVRQAGLFVPIRSTTGFFL